MMRMVDMATNFWHATYLPNQSSKEMWNWIQDMWKLVYIELPDHIRGSQGSYLVSNEMSRNLVACGFSIEEAPIENPGTMRMEWILNVPLRASYQLIW